MYTYCYVMYSYCYVCFVLGILFLFVVMCIVYNNNNLFSIPTIHQSGYRTCQYIIT